jgi:hypothetical protein
MPDYSERESRSRREFSHWGSLSAEVLSFNIHVGTNIAEYWRHQAEIHIAAFMSIAVALETPTGRRRKFRVIDGGKS